MRVHQDGRKMQKKIIFIFLGHEILRDATWESPIWSNTKRKRKTKMEFCAKAENVNK
jgi:hypothetical protein